MSEQDLKEYYDKYITDRIKRNAIISASGFKKYLIQQKFKITTLYKLDAWPEVRSELDVYYEDFLIEHAAQGERHSQTYTQLLNKFYDKQAKRGADKPAITIKLDFLNDGRNKI